MTLAQAKHARKLIASGENPRTVAHTLGVDRATVSVTPMTPRPPPAKIGIQRS